MSSSPIDTTFSAVYRPFFDGELTFLTVVEPKITTRPLVTLFVVDASHSMRLYIDSEKTMQRQTLVQNAIAIALNNPSIVRDGDFVGLITFSTEARSVIEQGIILITAESRTMLSTAVTNTLKSDGGQTNYGKAFNVTAGLLRKIKDLKTLASVMTGPVLVWFLTDGKPWPAESGNAELDILKAAEALGATGNDFWVIGISNDASQSFLERLALQAQLGEGAFQKVLVDTPKEFLQESAAKSQTLWLDFSVETHERLVFGLLNAIENTRINLGIIAEITVYLEKIGEKTQIEFLSGANAVEHENNSFKITLKRPLTLKIGHKLSMAFCLKIAKEDLKSIRLTKIISHFFRGEDLVSRTEQKIEKTLLEVTKIDSTIVFGSNQSRAALHRVHSELLTFANYLESRIVVDVSTETVVKKNALNELKEIQNVLLNRKGLTIP